MQIKLPNNQNATLMRLISQELEQLQRFSAKC